MNKILSFNSHTGYSYILSKTGMQFDICGNWDSEERPLPVNYNLITIKQAIFNIRRNQYNVILCHKRNELFKVLRYVNKRNYLKIIFVIHGRYQRTGISGAKLYRIAKFSYKQMLKAIKKIYNLDFVFITPCVKQSWNINGFVIMPGIDINDFSESDFSANKLLTVGNNLHRHYFRFNLLQEVAKELPITIVGYNPSLKIAKKAQNYAELISYYKSHNAFLYLADEPEEGFNLSLLEAMASGLPVVTMFHPTSPIIHGYNGFVSFTEKEYIEYCKVLLKDNNLAMKLGHNALETARIYFSIEEFVRKWRKIIEN